MHFRRISSPYRQLILALVLILFLVVYIQAIPTTPFFEDESHWIHTSIYWEILLGEPVNSPFWSENYWTLTQPPVTRYIIGLARNLQGVNSDQLNNPWDFLKSVKENIANNNMPTPDLLFATRVPMAILAALSGGVIFQIIFDGYGALSALLFVIFYAYNNFLKTTLVRAMGESPMLFFLILSSLFLILAIREFLIWLENESPDRKTTKFYILFSLSGIACGLAGASKINGLMASVSIAFVVLALLFFFNPALDKRQKIKLAARIIFTITFSATIVFILINPFLYTNPLSGIGLMAKFRLQEMSVQIEGFPAAHLNTFSERVPLLFDEVFSQLMPFRLTAAFYFSMAIIGVINLIKRLREWGQTKQKFPIDLVPLVVLLPLAVAGYATPLNWDRYLFPCVMVNIICVPIGIAYLLKQTPEIWKLVHSIKGNPLRHR